jgi:predicted alpha-1,6-mannanase (GH76 family)
MHMRLRRLRRLLVPLVTAVLAVLGLGMSPAVASAETTTLSKPHPTTSAADYAQAAATALQRFYDPSTGLWTGTGWWNGANDLTALLDLDRLSGSRAYTATAANTYAKQVNTGDGQFRNEYLDDTGWWGLAWIQAYDLTGDQRYLATARADADWMWSYWDGTCGGGIYWSTAKTYKNAIPNELFLKLAAQLHQRIPHDTTYLDRANQEWSWFAASGMINSGHLVNDGLDSSTCQNNGGQTWTYNQGVILGGLLELDRASGGTRPELLTEARQIATAATTSPLLTPGGVLTEPCEANGGDCGADGPSFNGIFVRNLGELNSALSDRPYSPFLARQEATLVADDRNAQDDYGVHWAGPFDKADPARQHSALDALTAAAWNA